MTNPIKRFFLFCSGATDTILKMNGCEVEHTKYAGIGVTIFFTAALAALSGGYAMFTVFRNTDLSFAFGLFWGLIIFNLDRFIVSSIRKKRVAANMPLPKRLAAKGGEILKAVPRLVLAVFISIVITRPIELKLFEVEIEGQITKDLTLERTTLDENVNLEYADIAGEEEETAQLRSRLIELQNELNRRIKVASGELEGWGGTTNPGEGPIYKQRQAEVKQAEEELNAFKSQYGPIIKAKEEHINTRKAERENRAKKAKTDIDNSRGLLRRLEALSKLTTDHLSIFLASGFIILLFISLETAPILVKLFSSRGPYDDYLDAIEHQVYAEQQKKMSDINDEINTDVTLGRLINAERSKLELQQSQNTLSSLQTLAPQELRQAQVEIAKKFISLWKNRQLKSLNHVTSTASYTAQTVSRLVPNAPASAAPTPPTNTPPPSSPSGAATSPPPPPVGASGATAHAGAPSNNGGGTHTGPGASAQAGAAQSAPQASSAPGGQQSSQSAPQMPGSHNSSSSTSTP